MIQKGFLWTLLWAAMGSIASIFILSRFIKSWQEHFAFGAFCVAFFVVFTFVAYIRGVQAVRSHNKNTFTAQLMALIIVKMILSVLLVVAYTKIVPNCGRNFIGLFMLPYIIFSVVEYYYLTQIAKLK